MFRMDQILSATAFLRSLKEVPHRLVSIPEPLLITQRNGHFIAIMDGDHFEGVMSARQRIMRMDDPIEDSTLYDLQSYNAAHCTARSLRKGAEKRS